MANIDIEFTDNSEIIAKKIKAAIHRALVRIGMQAERLILLFIKKTQFLP